MEAEETALLEGSEFRALELGSRLKVPLKQISLRKCDVLVGRSGVGLVNAGVLLASLLENYPVDAVILLGVGGALDDRLLPGDTVIARQIIQHDSIMSLEAGRKFIAPGELTLSAKPEEQVDPVMKSHPVLIQWVHTALSESPSGQIYEGSILSGSEFAGSSKRKAELRSLDADALMVDMEAAALAQITRKLGIPFVAAKTVADRANPQSVSDDYKTFLRAAAAHSRSVFQALLKTFG